MVMYVDASKLVEYQARTDLDGHVMTNHTSPFQAFSGIWYEQEHGSW